MTAKFYVTATIEGALNQWATSHAADFSPTHGRAMRSGLKHAGITVSERTDIRAGTFEGDTITLQIATTEANDEFSRAAQQITQLASSVTTTSTTTVNVRNNSLIIDGQYIHIGTECMLVTDASSNALVVTRAQRGTVAQIHLRNPDGAGAFEVPVFNKIYAFEGRRVTIDAFENGALATVYRGIISQAPYLNETGTMWLVDVDPLTKLLEQTVGAFGTIGAKIRGLKLADDSALGCILGGVPQFSLYGFYENEVALLNAINAEVSALTISGVSAQWVTLGVWYRQGVAGPAVAQTDRRRLMLHIRTAGSAIPFPDLQIASALLGTIKSGGAAWWLEFSGGQTGIFPVNSNGSTELAANTNYVAPFFNNATATGLGGHDDAPWSMPASMIGRFTRPPSYLIRPPFFNADAEAGTTTKRHMFAIDRDIGQAVGSVITLVGPTLPEPLNVTITAIPATLQIEFDAVADDLRGYCDRNAITTIMLDERTEVTARANLGHGNFSDFITAVIAAAPLANLGMVPQLLSADIDPSSSAVLTATNQINALTDRDYNALDAVSLADVIGQELLLLGMMMRTNTDSQIEFIPFTRRARASRFDSAFDSSSVVTRYGDTGRFPGWMPAVDGIVSTVEIHATNDGDVEPHIYRDIASISANKNRGPGMLVIEPESATSRELTINDALIIGGRIVDFFGNPYEVVTFTVARTATALAVRCGDIVSLTSPHVPNSTDGTRGIVGRRCTVIGRTVSYDPPARGATVEIVAIMHGDVPGSIAGYTPTRSITAAVLLSGTSWTLTCDAIYSAPPASFDYLYFTAGDFVTIMEAGVASPASGTATVTSQTGTTSVVVDFGGAAPWGGTFSGAYVMKFSPATVGVTDAQADYAYVADTALLLWDANPARLFG